jgi:DNA-binding NarL/FixJ family response regulator
MFRSGVERVGETSEAPDRDNEQQPDAERIRVMVVDDHPVWRDGLKADLERMGAATVVSEAADGGEAIDRARDAMPEVILMDLRLPTVDGVEATRMIVEESPHVRVLVVSASGEEADVLEAVKAGAAGYLLKSATAEEITDAVQRIHAGEPVFTPSLAGLVLAEFRRVAGKEPTEPVLTVRENEILKLVAKGYSYREIAEKLFISVKTVQNHVQNILTKLQLRRRYELMRYAIHRGLDRGPDPEP